MRRTLLMNKMKFETPNITIENIAKLAELFPGVVAEGKVNMDLLRSYVGEEVYADEAYEFTWVGKRAVIEEAGRPIRKTLRPCVEESKNWDITENLYIEGDNLDVLKLLQESYLGKVKMIYIDPPYNTGNDFIYRDDFKQNKEEYNEGVGVYDEEGERLFKNTETNGRFHSDWCNMIYPRLVLARNILHEDGIIFISIDDSEVVQLRKICEEIFGESNFYCQFVWQRRSGSMDSVDNVSTDHEYILCYAKSKSMLNGVARTFAKYANPDNDKRGPWIADNLSAGKAGGDVHYPIVDPETGNQFLPPKGRFWPYSPKTMAQKIEEGRVIFPKTESGRPMLKRFQYESKREVIPVSTLMRNHTDKNLPNNAIVSALNTFGTSEMQKLFGEKVFSYPKSTVLIESLLAQATNVTSSDIILDFFSGSATTAHAVMQLNAEDGGNRKFIMVQLPEVCAKSTEAAKAGYKNICEIGKERIRRAGDKIISENVDKEGIENLDIGFRVLKLDDSNMNDVYYAAGDYTQDMLTMLEGNIKSDRTDMDLLYGCLLDWGLPLSMPHTHEKIDGFTVHTYNDGDLIACFDEHISEKAIREIAERRPLRAVFRDSSFSSSPDKINVFEIFKLLAPNTNVRVI